jgi:hypothetical protein
MKTAVIQSMHNSLEHPMHGTATEHKIQSHVKTKTIAIPEIHIKHTPSLG